MSFTLYSPGPARSRVSKSAGFSRTSWSMAASTSARNVGAWRSPCGFTVPLPSGQEADPPPLGSVVLVVVGAVVTGVLVTGGWVTGGRVTGAGPWGGAAQG